MELKYILGWSQLVSAKYSLNIPQDAFKTPSLKPFPKVGWDAFKHIPSVEKTLMHPNLSLTGNYDFNAVRGGCFCDIVSLSMVKKNEEELRYVVGVQENNDSMLQV